ncbi:hypothetical protein ACHAXN_006478 [Cyclotella atomus]
MKFQHLLPVIVSIAVLPRAASFSPPTNTANRKRSASCSLSTQPLASRTESVPILTARQPLPSFVEDANESFSILSWNILLPNSQDNWWCHKQYSSNVDMDKRQWKHRHSLIKDRLLQSAADIICIQEADGDTFAQDFAFMKEAGYDHVLHKKFRFRCATFFKDHKFVLDQASHKDRTLVTALRCKSTDSVLHIVNCHLSGGTAPERRLRQVHDGLNQVRKYISACEIDLTKQMKGNRPSKKLVEKAQSRLHNFRNGGILVVGDFNSDGNTAVRKLLVEGCVDKEWREPQYPSLPLTSTRREHSFGSFTDAAELAYGVNVCDGDYGDANSMTFGTRPATYVVPNLASLLLLPVAEQKGPPRTQFGQQIARGVAATLNLNDWCAQELDLAFDQVDKDGNGVIDGEEISALLEDVYVSTYGQQIQQERNNFFRGFGKSSEELTKDQFISRLMVLQQDNEGERKAFGLAMGFNLRKLSDLEMGELFDKIDLDGNGFLDEDEYQELLKTAYLSIYGEEIDMKRNEFFTSFQNNAGNELTKEQFTERLLALHQELEGGRKGSELAEVKTDADVQKMIERFTPLLRNAIDEVFRKFSANGVTMTQEEVNQFLRKTNDVLGRGGMFRSTSAIFERKVLDGIPAELSLDDLYGVFARELAEGKWWQVVYDLDVCGCSIRSQHLVEKSNQRDQFYQGWLDYIYFNKITCKGVQEALTEIERQNIYNDGNALPNEWHPSDHLPVAAIFSWNQPSAAPLPLL